MTKRTYSQKDGTEWVWEETTELVKLLTNLHKTKEKPAIHTL